jgi:hypothetical protein
MSYVVFGKGLLPWRLSSFDYDFTLYTFIKMLNEKKNIAPKKIPFSYLK